MVSQAFYSISHHIKIIAILFNHSQDIKFFILIHMLCNVCVFYLVYLVVIHRKWTSLMGLHLVSTGWKASSSFCVLYLVILELSKVLQNFTYFGSIVQNSGSCQEVLGLASPLVSDSQLEYMPLIRLVQKDKGPDLQVTCASCFSLCLWDADLGMDWCLVFLPTQNHGILLEWLYEISFYSMRLI